MRAFLATVVALALALTGCQAPMSLDAGNSAGPAAPTFTLDATRAIDAIAGKPNAIWQDAFFNTTAIKARRRQSGYRVQTTALGASWSRPLAATSTNGAAYAHNSTSFGNQSPNAGERVYVVCDDASGTVMKLDPTSTGAPIGANFTALTGLVGAGTITRSAAVLSGDNKRLYLLSSGGYLVVLDTATGLRKWSCQLSTSGFAGIAPFVDYANGGGTSFGDEFLYAVSADGSLYRCEVTAGGVAVTAWLAGSGSDKAAYGAVVPNATAGVTLVSKSTLPYAGAVSVQASALVWNGKAFFGDAAGNAYRIDTTAAPTLQSVHLSSYGITTSPAVDFDASFTNISTAFFAAGDRLVWVDGSTPSSLSVAAVSPSLALDKKPPSAILGTSGVLSGFSYGGPFTPVTIPANDTIAAAAAQPAASDGPSRWGTGTAWSQDYPLGAGTNPYQIYRNAGDGTFWVTCKGDSKLRHFNPATGVVTGTYDGVGSYATQVQTIPVGAGSSPSGFWNDPNGGVWVTCPGLNTVVHLDLNGVVLRTYTSVGNAPWAIVGQAAGTTVTDLWITSTGDNTLLHLNPTSGAVTVYTPPGTRSMNRSRGMAFDTNGLLWIANTGDNTSNMANGQDTSYPTTPPKGSSITIFNPAMLSWPKKFACGGAPTSLVSQGGEMWVACYRWFLDHIEKYNVSSFSMDASTANGGGGVFGVSHWQPAWLTVDPTTGDAWYVNGNSANMDHIAAAPTAGTLTIQATYGVGSQPRGIAIDSTGKIWSADSTAQTCTKYTNTGGSLGTYPVGNTPFAVTCDKNDVTWVANQADGTVTRIGPSVAPPAPFNAPKGVTMDGAGNVWIANSGNNTVSVVDQSGQPQAIYTTGASPVGVGVQNTTTAYVAANGVNLINTVKVATSVLGSVAAGLPFDVAVDAANNAWVSNSSSAQITKITPAGVTSTVALGTTPKGVAVDPATQAVWVADQGENALRTIASGANTATGPYGTAAAPVGVAVGNSLVWAAHPGSNAVSRFNANATAGRAGLGTSLGSYTFATANQPTNLIVDPNGHPWVANAAGNSITKLWHAGTTDLVAAANYVNGDTNASLAYLHFTIAPAAFGGGTPTTSALQLTATSNSALASETLASYASPLTLGSGVAWVGNAGTANVDWNSRPAVNTASPLGSLATAVTSGAVVSVPLGSPLVADQPNSSLDAVNGLSAFAFQSTGANLADVAHWQSTGAGAPQLVVQVTTTKLPAGVGLASQPTIDTLYRKVYVVGSNVTFELLYDTVANFQNPAKVAFSYPAAGKSFGTVQAGKYVVPSGSCTLTAANDLLAIDYDPVANVSYLSAFRLPGAMVGGFFLDTSGNNSAQLGFTATSPGKLTNTQLMYDYDYGSTYITSGTTISCVRLLQ